MKTSPKGIAFIKQWEGKNLRAYDDGGGTWTIGWGHIRGVHKGMVITTQQAESFLAEDIAEAEDAVNKAVRVPLTQGQFDVLVSFTMNLGVGALNTSTLLKMLNKGQYQDVPTQLIRWVYDDPDGAGPKPPHVVLGLQNRRNAEMDMWREESHAVNPIEPGGSRTLNGGTATIVAGGAVAAESVREIAQEAQWSFSGSNTIMAILGAIIVIAGLWVLYSRLDDAKMLPWQKKPGTNA